jgi:hypothetical protein
MKTTVRFGPTPFFLASANARAIPMTPDVPDALSSAPK